MGWCIGQNVLKDFFERNGSEVMNMLFNEFSLEDELAAEREAGWEEGREKGREEIARNALAKGASLDFVREITGLDSDTLARLSAR
jgi:predicted transposase YdaD